MEPHRVHDTIHSLSGRDFEHFMGEFWARGGWCVEVTQQSRDGGIDVYLDHPTVSHTVGIDTKRHQSTTYSPSDVENWYDNLSDEVRERTDVVGLLSTTKFTRSAKRVARIRRIDLIGLRSVCKAISDVDPQLCHWWENGTGRVETDQCLKNRYAGTPLTITQGAREVLRDSPRFHELLYIIERDAARSRDDYILITQPRAEEYERELSSPARPTRYPLHGSDSYLVATEQRAPTELP